MSYSEEQPSTCIWKNLSNTTTRFKSRLCQIRRKLISPTLTRLGRRDKGIDHPENLVHLLHPPLRKQISHPRLSLCHQNSSNAFRPRLTSQMLLISPQSRTLNQRVQFPKRQDKRPHQAGTPKGFYPHTSILSVSQ